MNTLQDPAKGNIEGKSKDQTQEALLEKASHLEHRRNPIQQQV